MFVDSAQALWASRCFEFEFRHRLTFLFLPTPPPPPLLHPKSVLWTLSLKMDQRSEISLTDKSGFTWLPIVMQPSFWCRWCPVRCSLYDLGSLSREFSLRQCLYGNRVALNKPNERICHLRRRRAIDCFSSADMPPLQFCTL